ncbi:hypothetical protein BV20DRAFT_956448 [Pilatotrama ljubarskyi]|nr:hypothetical protein BV20DRAFT_959001 [Pilatotrama ljubarskyi]KAI0364335.1 hypothetical protein BV20DRAFT_956448 [Pilatotrama ljubarskyi]
MPAIDSDHLSLKSSSDEVIGGLLQSESRWTSLQPWLQEHGYILCPRYRPGWTPSWIQAGKSRLDCEDGRRLLCSIMDATRAKDRMIVGLKKVEKSLYPHESDIGKFLSTEPQASDPRNHCVPIYDVLQSPLDDNMQILIMPYLMEYKGVRFSTVGEAVECIRQLFEGLVFMHEHCIAHRDINNTNIMMEPVPLFSEVPHPTSHHRSYDFARRVKCATWTKRPTRYYFIDFGLSRRYSPDDPSPLELQLWGGDKTVPEFRRSEDPQNPFWTDIYYFGNFMREDFLQSCKNFDFLELLVNDMVQDDPSKRPSAAKAFARFENMRLSLSTWRLRSHVIYRDDSSFLGFFRACRHAVITLGYMMDGRPALPIPSSPSPSLGSPSIPSGRRPH